MSSQSHSSFAPDDTRYRALFVSCGSAAFRDENQEPSLLMTASDASRCKAPRWRQGADGFLMNAGGGPASVSGLAMVSPDGGTVWTNDAVGGIDRDRVAVVGDTVLYVTAGRLRPPP